MWRVLVFLSCFSFCLVACCDDDTPTTTASPTPEPEPSCGVPPPRCGKNEVYNNCSDTICRPTLCSELGYSLKCDKKCKPGCVCKEDYLRNENGVCIPIKNCPSCGGDKNAEYGCGTNCGKTCLTYNPKPAACSHACIMNGCDCRDGFAYDSNVKACVRPKDCTPSCKVNEVYSPCINGGCGLKNCSQVGQPNVCIAPVTCIKGCVCVKGYLRASNGTCIPKDQCTLTCTGQNEYFDSCIHFCTNQSCSDIGKSFNCPNMRTGQCDSSGCRCKPGTYRNASNVCVPERECPTPDCPTNELWEWCPTVKCEGDNCQKTRDSPQTCPIGIDCDNPRCICGYNMKRDWKTRKCIKIADCPPFKCDANEEYVACPPDCSGENCSDYINNTKCPPYRIGIISNCRPECRCIKGYYRNTDRKCIPACECPTTPAVEVKP